MADTKTATTTEVVEKAGSEFNADNVKFLKAFGKQLGECHKMYKEWLTAKGHAEPDGDEGGADTDHDGDGAAPDPFETDKGKALIAEVETLKASIPTPEQVAEAIAKLEADKAEAARKEEEERKAAEEAERKAAREAFLKANGLD